MKNSRWVHSLKSDLKYPLKYEMLYNNINSSKEISNILKNKDYYVSQKIKSCKLILDDDYHIDSLVEKNIIEINSIGELIVNKTFATRKSFRSNDIVVKGPVALEKNVIIGRSTIIGPAYISKKSQIFDSRIRGGSSGSVYIGENCSLWDHTVIIRSFIGDNTLVHTCNVDDSIVGPNSNFGAANLISDPEYYIEQKLTKDDVAKLDRRIVLANYSYGNSIKLYDPINDGFLDTGLSHFGSLSGSGVWLASGTIIYPGTIIGHGSKLNCTVPMIGYIPPESVHSLFFSIKNNKIEPKGTLKKYFINWSNK